MKEKPYIENRLINMRGVMPTLGNDFTIRRDSPLLFIGMIPIPENEGGFDYLVIAFRSLSESYTPFPMGILPKLAHPMFLTQTKYGDIKEPAAWYGKARFRDYKMALESLDQINSSSTSMRRFRNLNTVAEGICKRCPIKSYAPHVIYAGHEFLG